MWLLPRAIDDARRADLPAGSYFLPWYYTRAETRRTVALLEKLVRGIDVAVVAPWQSLETLKQRGAVAAPGAMWILDPRSKPPAEDRWEEALLGLGGRYVLTQPKAPRETGYGWQERFLKPALVSALREHFTSPEHPFSPFEIAGLPVLEAAALTPDLHELIALLEATIAHRLRYARYGTAEQDYYRSLMLAAGERLARRLRRLPDKTRSCALEVLLAEGRAESGERRARGARGLERIGLARVVAGDVSMGPLARRVRERVVWGALTQNLPSSTWTDEARKRLAALDTEPYEGAMPSLPAAKDWIDLFIQSSGPSPAVPLDPGLDGQGLEDLLSDLASVDESAAALPEALQQRVVATLLTIRHHERAAPPAGRAFFSAKRAYLRFKAARGKEMHEQRERAVAELEATAELSPTIGPAMADKVWLKMAQMLTNRPRDAADLDRAEELASRALSVASTGSLACIGARYLLGTIADRRGRKKEAKSHFAKAHFIAQRWTFHLPEGIQELVLKEMAILVGGADDSPATAAEYQAVLGVARELGSLRMEADVLCRLGSIEAAAGKMESSSGYYEQALRIYGEIGDRRGEATSFEGLGLAYQALDQIDKAIGHFERALVIAREIGDRRGEGYGLVWLGIACERLRQVDKATALFEQALPIAEAIDDRPLIDLAAANLARLRGTK